jgi:hypothetical protein
VLKFLSVKSIVIAPAKTGREKRSKNAVIKTDHTNKGNLCIDKPGTLILNMVVIKFIAPSKEETPAKCKLKIAKSTEPPECATIELNGGYTVQPVPAPNSTNDEDKLILFNLGNAISGAPIINGTNQLPKPPIMTGITKKNIITKACAVITTLYS